jgi:hypothetical protein
MPAPEAVWSGERSGKERMGMVMFLNSRAPYESITVNQENHRTINGGNIWVKYIFWIARCATAAM